MKKDELPEVRTHPGNLCSPLSKINPRERESLGFLRKIAANPTEFAGFTGTNGFRLSILIAVISFLIPFPLFADDVKPFITNGQFLEILVDLGVSGTTVMLPARVTKGLGLTHLDETLTVKLDSFKDDAGAFHFIAKLDNDAGFIVSVTDLLAAHDFYVNKDRVLVSAISVTEKNGVVSIPNKDAQKLLDVEWVYWAGMADRLSTSGVNKK